MGGFRFNLEMRGTRRLRTIYQQVRNLGENPTPLMQIAATLLRSSTLDRFDDEKGPGGIPWPKSKRALGLAPGANGKKQVGRTLTDTADLRNSITALVRPHEVEVGTDGGNRPVKAFANQFGVNHRGVVLPHTRIINSAFGVPLPEPREVKVRAHPRQYNLPARPFIGFDDDDRRELQVAWRDHLTGLFQ